MNQHEQNADVIDAAADRIFRLGWFRLGEPCQSLTAECAYQAIATASLAFDDAAGPAALLAMSEHVGLVTYWNDAQPDADTVIAKLRECADAERAKA